MAEEIQHTETTRTTETHQEKKSSLLSDILSIIGFAILFIIIIWGLVHLVSLSSGWFSSLFYRAPATIQVTAPANATSGDPVSISWNYTTNVKGSYAFLYQCKTGLQFEVKNPDQNATSTYLGIPCGVAFSAPSTNNSVTLLPILSASTSTPDTLTVVFIPSQTGSQVQGSATMTINPVVATVQPVKPAAKPVTYTNPQTTYSGPADLSVRIISENVDQTGAGTVSFDIANIGGSPSGTYYFSAQLPTAQPYPYTSPLQSSLSAGSHIVDTLHFTDVASGGGIFSVSVNVNDVDPSNNYASEQITAPYTNYNYNNNYNPAPYTVYPTYTY